MSSHVNIALEAQCATACCRKLYITTFHTNYLAYSQIVGLTRVISSLKLLWSEASSSSKLCSKSSNKYILLVAIRNSDCYVNETRPRITPRIKMGYVDIWRWCHTSFQSYRTQLCNDSDNIGFKFHFLLKEMHKAVCAVRECKKKTLNSIGEKKIKK
jgi:hypothetical protein